MLLEDIPVNSTYYVFKVYGLHPCHSMCVHITRQILRFGSLFPCSSRGWNYKVNTFREEPFRGFTWYLARSADYGPMVL